MLTVGDLREILRDLPDRGAVRVDIHHAAIRRPVDAFSRSTVDAAVVVIQDGSVAILVDPENDSGRERDIRSRLEALGVHLRQATSAEPTTGADRADWVVDDQGRHHVFQSLDQIEVWLAERETP